MLLNIYPNANYVQVNPGELFVKHGSIWYHYLLFALLNNKKKENLLNYCSDSFYDMSK